jgi:S1-C subfamily serine protease
MTFASRYFFRDLIRKYLLVAFVATIASNGLFAQDGERRSFRPDFDLPGKSPFQRTHYSVLKTFREVTADHWTSTVRVLQNEVQLALGVVVEADGWIISKSSEVPDGELRIRFSDANRSPARVVSRRPDLDLALIKVDRSSLSPIKWNAADSIQVGAFAVTVDSRPLPLAIGVVSVKPRTVRPGQAVLGIRLVETDEGVRAERVLDSGGAARAGILENDLIVAINGVKSKSQMDIQNMITSNRPGDRITVSIDREGEALDLDAQLTDLNIVLSDPDEAEVNGMISARASDFPSAFQHDTVITPNQCGGPIVDLHGHVVGLNIARGGRVHSFALPMDLVVPAVADMLKSATIALKKQTDGDNVLVESIHETAIANLR